jgi:hypothetical protein
VPPRVAGKGAVHRIGRDGAPPGQADRFARASDRFAGLLRLLLGFSSLATAGVALWLFWVIAVVLPARDPLHIPMWRIAAVGFLAHSALSWAYLLRGPRNPLLRWLLLALSVAAIGLGLYGVVTMIRTAGAGGHFEGYIVLMGLILGGHGWCAVAYTILTQRVARRLRAA